MKWLLAHEVQLYFSLRENNTFMHHIRAATRRFVILTIVDIYRYLKHCQRDINGRSK